MQDFSKENLATYSGAVMQEEMVEGEGFEPSKAVPADLQSDPFGHSGTPPQVWCASYQKTFLCKGNYLTFLSDCR